MKNTPPAFKAIVLVAITGLIASVAALGFLVSRSRLPPPADPTQESFYEGFEVKPFAFTDQDGEPVTEAVFEGEVTVLEFFFTSCPLACPGMTAAMMDIADRLDDTPVRFAGISVDGETDTPEVLRAYMERYGMDPAEWTLMTAPQDEVRELLEEGLGLTLKSDASMTIPIPSGGTTLNVNHPTRLLLIGPDRSLVYAASYTRDEEIDLLVERARGVAASLDD